MKTIVLVFTLGLPAAESWFDTGHMLVAEVAKMHLSPSEVQAVDKLLSTWESDFPGMSDFVSSSVWPDHIKCVRSDSAPLCRGLPATGLNECLGSNLQRRTVPGRCLMSMLGSCVRFNSWHFVDLDFNPDTQLRRQTSD